MRPPGDGVAADAPTKKLLFSAPDFLKNATTATHATFAISVRTPEDAMNLKTQMEAAGAASAGSSAASAGADEAKTAAPPTPPTEAAAPAASEAPAAAAAVAAAAAPAAKEGGDHVDTSRLLLPSDELRKSAFVKIEAAVEDDETELLSLRCRLRVFVEKDEYGDEVREKFWKEKGTGQIALLKSAKTGIVRCVMRQESTLKVFSNFNVPAGFTMRPPGDGVAADAPTKKLLFSAPDFLKNATTETHAAFAISVRSTEDAMNLKTQMEAAAASNASAAGAVADVGAALEKLAVSEK
jgi:hypothetical protein